MLLEHAGPPGPLREVREEEHRASRGVAFGRGLAVLSICYKIFLLSYLLSILSLLHMALLSPPG